MKAKDVFKKITIPVSLIYLIGFMLMILHLQACKETASAVKQQLPEESNGETKLTQKDKLDQEVEKLMEEHHIPGVNIAILKKGALHSTRTYGVQQVGKPEPINEETMFSVGSISKFVNATFILKLVAEGKLDLDEHVNEYLSSWKIEENRYTKKYPVNLRRILSHTAGLTVHGFADYLPEEKLPTTVEILKGTSPAKNPKVYVDLEVGSKFRYSGGGITITQLITEDVTGMSYHKAVQETLFEPLGMKRSSYENPLPQAFGNIAKAHDENGNPVALPRGYQSMPEAAASGLWTTPSDLAKVLSMLLEVYYARDNEFLPKNLVEDMMTEEKASQYGLGPEIEQRNGETIFYHDGANDSYRAHFKVFLTSESGYVIFTNGTDGLGMINDLKPLLDAFVQ